MRYWNDFASHNTMDKPSNVQVPEVLDIFHAPPEKCGIQNVRFIEYHPISAVNSSNPIEFQIPGSGDQYIDLSRTYVYLKVKVEKKGAEGGKEDVSTTNLWFHSLFEGVEIQLQQKVLQKYIGVSPLWNRAVKSH